MSDIFEEAGLTDDERAQEDALSSSFIEDDGDGAADDSHGDDEGYEPEGEVDADGIDLAPGLKLSRHEADQLAQFYRALSANPAEVAAAMAQAYLEPQGYELTRKEQAERAAEQEMPDLGDEYVDPAIRQMYEEIQGLKQEQARRTQAEARAYHQEGVRQFHAAHPGLKPDEIRAIDAEAARLGMIYATAQGNHPITATAEALERTYRQIPEYWEREVAERQAALAKDNKRQRRFSGLNGTDGSVPRQRREPSTPQEKTEAMVAMIRDHWGRGNEE